MHDFSLTFEKRLLKKKKKKKIPVWLHDQTDNIQKMQGDTLLDQWWYQVDSSSCCPVKKNFMTQ